MQAMHGSAVSSHRRGRLIGCVLALLALTALVAPSLASAAKKPVEVKTTYLALGDSLAFGYSQQLFNECEHLGEPPTCFENGYVNDFYKATKGEKNGEQLTNDGCPGETTESLIGEHLAAYANYALAESRKQEEEETGQPSPEVTGEAPCAYQEVDHLTLHHPYPGESQLENTLKTIATDSAAGTPVRVITLNIGANDELHFLKACEKKAEEEVGKSAAEGKYNKQVESEIGKGEFTAEEGAGTEPADKQRGEKDAKADGETKGKECVAKGANALFAQIAKNTQGILVLIRHAAEFGIGVNYEGPILYQGGYNPYGNVYGSGEVVKGTNELAGVENLIQHKVVHFFGACFTDPQNTFNPRNSKEPERLQKYTNMANFTEYEGKKNGPDIHPTPVGYKKLASLLKSEAKKAEKAGECIPGGTEAP
jgi:lysophospholipase L1-like esterase